MKAQIILILSIQFFFLLKGHANQCVDYLNLLPASAGGSLMIDSFAAEDLIPVQVQKHPEPILLKPGETVWGYYECENCSTEVSTMPGERQCVNCGKPHSAEPLDEIAPAVFRKTERIGSSTFNQIFLVNPGRLSADRAMDRLAKTGVADECPFCGVTDFDLSVGCRGCGAETSNANDIRKYALRQQQAALRNSTRISQFDSEMVQGRGLPPLNTNVMQGPNPNGPNLTEIAEQLEAIDAENEGRRARPIRSARQRSDDQGTSGPRNQSFWSKINFTRRGAMILAASTMLAATPMGYMWGTTTYTHMAEVTSINDRYVTVEYFKSQGQTEDVRLVRQPNDPVTWHLGEQVELYFVNWKLGNPTGAERGNGDVSVPAR